jgi:hypothetical protein
LRDHACHLPILAWSTFSNLMAPKSAWLGLGVWHTQPEAVKSSGLLQHGHFGGDIQSVEEPGVISLRGMLSMLVGKTQSSGLQFHQDVKLRVMLIGTPDFQTASGSYFCMLAAVSGLNLFG